ncbi:MAG: DUF4383 domain-containing protein [Cyanobacteria bacterium J06606_4]
MSVRSFALATGLLYSVLGLFGLVSGFVEPAQSVPSFIEEIGVAQGFGYLFGLFPIDVFEGFVYLVIGVMGIAAFAGNEVVSRLYAEALAVWLGFLAILGCIPIANTVFGLMPIYGSDVWLHGVTALLGAYFGFFLDKGRRGKDPSPSQPLEAPFTVKQ